MCACVCVSVCVLRRYRGRVLNRASRIAGLAKTGQVWASEDAWLASETAINSQDDGFGILSHVRDSLTLRGYKNDDHAGALGAELAACDAGHTRQSVSAVPLPIERLKGVLEEVGISLATPCMPCYTVT